MNGAIFWTMSLTFEMTFMCANVHFVQMITFNHVMMAQSSSTDLSDDLN